MRRFLTFLVLLTVIFSAFSVISFADDKKALYDRAGLFSEREAEKIESVAKKHFSRLYASVYIVTDKNRYGSVDYYGEDFRREYGISGDAVILIITDNGRNNYDLYTYGKCDRKISTAEVNKILDSGEVYGNIKRGNYKEGVIAFIEQSAKACKTNYGAVIAVSLIVSGIITAVFVFAVVYSYKKKLRSDTYPLNRFAHLDLNVNRDNFMGSFVSVRVISSGSGKGGRSGGFGGGGGSGHRGGR